MARPRIELQNLLEETAGVQAYFQPPNGLKMVYPCITYERDTTDTTFADNLPYSINKRYTVTVIDRNPDSDIPDKIALLPTCVHNRFFVADNLNHDVFTLYF
jgi:hypothetical protein